MKTHVVFDCMIFLQGAGRPLGPARACFRLVENGDVTLFLSPEIVAEVQDVLTRPKTLRKFPLLSSEWVTTFVGNVKAKAVIVDNVPKVFSLVRDPKDETLSELGS